MHRLLLLMLISVIWCKQCHGEFSTLPSYLEGVADLQITRPEAETATTTVFELGSSPYTLFDVPSSDIDPTSPPKPLLIASPTAEGVYPVILFCHGFLIQNHDYSGILSQVASHGYIVVAPQFYGILGILTSQYEEIKDAGSVTDWMSLHLQSRLPSNVEANLQKVALAGHSRGGKTAFALALGYAPTKLRYSLIVGVDPVAGTNANSETSPEILNHGPDSFNLSMPAIVLGTGLGPEKLNFLTPPCAPKGVNHVEFYNNSKPSKGHFVIADYGHMDMLDDSLFGINLCRSGKGSRSPMRRTVGGLVVAFSNKYLKGEFGDADYILANPGISPAKLDPFEFVHAAAAGKASI